MRRTQSTKPRSKSGNNPRGKPKAPALRRVPNFEGIVRDLTSRGWGVVAHPDGRVFFVPGVWIGERGVFEIVKYKGRGGEARLVELTCGSAQREAPPCPHHGFTGDRCGGCPWMFISYAEQLAAKQRRVERALLALDCQLQSMPILASPQVHAYRNRAQLKTNGRQLGFVAASANTLAPVDDCLVLNPHNRQTLRELRAQLPNRDWQPPRGQAWTTLDIDDHLAPSELSPGNKRPFMQGNTAQNHRMREWLANALDSLADKDRRESSLLIELFAGSGNFTDVAVASGYGAILAIDSFAPAMDSLRARKLPGVRAQHRDLYSSEIDTPLAEDLAQAHALLLDPPREGFKNLGAYLELATQLRWMIYISCDLATFSRDGESAMQHGFAMQCMQPLDLFPQTPHVELMSVWTRTV